MALRKTIPVTATLLLWVMLCAGATYAAAEENPNIELSDLPEDPVLRGTMLMNYVDDLWRGESSRAEIRMQVKTEHWERTMEMKAWSLGKEYSLVRITSPKKEEGTATLKYRDEIYNYLPKTDRTIKITSGMMMGSWMGSHFTNDDLVKESRYSEDYTSRVIFEGEDDGKMIWRIQLDPKPDAPVVWGKIVFEIIQSTLMPVRAIYYDEDGETVRTMSFSDFKEMDGRLVPAKLRLTPEDEPGEFTELTYLDMAFGVDVSESFFSLRNLKRTN